MLNKTTKFLLLFIAISLVNACQSDSSIGPCDYSEEKFKMTIIDVLEDTDDDNHLIVLVDFSGNTPYSNETWKLEDVRDVKTTLKFVQENHITPGNIYSGTIYNKIEGSGDCEDEFIDWNQSFK